MRRLPLLSVVYVLMLLCIGLGYMAIMPLFEGFDETAHFSSIRQIADTKTLPTVDGKTYLDKEVTEYKGPSPYGSLIPPYDLGLTYSRFFEQGDANENYSQTYRQPHPHSSFSPSSTLNYETQHPPLYYAVLAPLEKVTDHLSFVTQFFLLRIASYLFAVAGVVFGLLAIRRSGNAMTALLGFLAYPILFPMFFPEFARLGNDSLCLFCVGLVALLLSAWMRQPDNYKLALAIGSALAIGLLTKAFFVPITACLVFVLVVRVWQRKTSQEIRGILCILILPVLVGIAWYIYQAKTGGAGIAGIDNMHLAQHGGLLVNLRAHSSVFSLGRACIATLVTWVWGGTWSLARLPLLMYLPLLALVGWVVAAYLLEMRRRPLSDIGWLPIWLYIVFLCGLADHVITSQALLGVGNAPGWYLHILMPWAAPAVGIGLCSIWRHARARFVLIGLLLYAVLFQIAAVWAEVALFAGCAIKGEDKYYSFPDHSFCLVRTPQLIGQLAILGWPVLAAVGFGGGIICAVWLVIAIRKSGPQCVAALDPLGN